VWVSSRAYLNYKNNLNQAKEVARTIFSTLYTSYDKVVLYLTFFQDLKWKTKLLNLSNLRSRDLVLDIGIGTGLLQQFYQNYTVPRFIGIDMSEEMLKVCMNKKLRCIDDLVLADAEKLPFRDCSFDVVVSCYVAKYCRQNIFCKQVSSALKKHGRLVLYDFAKPTNAASLHYIYVFAILPFFGRLAAILAKNLGPTLRELPRIIATSDWEMTIEKQLLKNGFTEVKSELLNANGARLFTAEKLINDNYTE
jgi:demethylmenaquinone methyltransferase/2-methoxy-6-polyprenyl-1,4-benzoquinol methylase